MATKKFLAKFREDPLPTDMSTDSHALEAPGDPVQDREGPLPTAMSTDCHALEAPGDPVQDREDPLPTAMSTDSHAVGAPGDPVLSLLVSSLQELSEGNQGDFSSHDTSDDLMQGITADNCIDFIDTSDTNFLDVPADLSYMDLMPLNETCLDLPSAEELTGFSLAKTYQQLNPMQPMIGFSTLRPQAVVRTLPQDDQVPVDGSVVVPGAPAASVPAVASLCLSQYFTQPEQHQGSACPLTSVSCNASLATSLAADRLAMTTSRA